MRPRNCWWLIQRLVRGSAEGLVEDVWLDLQRCWGQAQRTSTKSEKLFVCLFFPVALLNPLTSKDALTRQSLQK